MDAESRDDVERRLIEVDQVVERCDCPKTGKKKTVIRGYAALFQSDSQDLGGFVERILPGAFDNVFKRGTDVVALYNHEPMFILGRESAGTLRLSVDERGLRYEIDAPESRADVVEAIERGDVRGSSFAFRCKGAGERWSRMADGRQLREILDFDGLFDVGPVLRPAYAATETFVSKRALDMARNGTSAQNPEVIGNVTPNEQRNDDAPVEASANPVVAEEAEAQIEERAGVSLKPTAGMASAARRGLKLHEEGKSGDGLKPETVARANKLARREQMNEAWVREMNAWFARHESASKSSGWDTPGEEKPGFVAWLLWGGNAAKNWSARKVKELDGERDLPPDDDERELPEEGDDEMSLSPANFALYEAIEQIAVENGPWPQEGADGAHYMTDNPFAERGVKCQNCVFWNEGGSCDVVDGEIEPEAVCKLWVIPEEKLAAKPEPPPADRSIDAAAEAARLSARSLEAAFRGRRTR